MLVRVGIAKAHIVIGERRNGEDQAVIEQAHLHTRSHLQTMEAAVVGVGTYCVCLTVNQLFVRLVHNRLVVVRVVRPDIQIDILGSCISLATNITGFKLGLPCRIWYLSICCATSDIADRDGW